MQVELTPFQAREVFEGDGQLAEAITPQECGVFPLSWLAKCDAAGLAWLEGFNTRYFERDISELGSRIRATTLRRLLDQSKLAATPGIIGPTVGRYIDLLCDLMLVR